MAVVKVSSPKALGGMNAESVATLIATAADIAFVLDGDGVIRDVLCRRPDLAAALEDPSSLRGRRWEDTVAPGSRQKVETLLREAAHRPSSAWHQVNHSTAHGGEVRLLYAAVQTARNGSCIAIGRDMQAVASLQQRLLEAQISMERDYSRLRHAETRYRLLFQMSAEPVLMVDATTGKTVEANPAALELFGDGASRLIGHRLVDAFHRESTGAITALLADARASGKADAVRIKLEHDTRPRSISARLFRQENTPLLLVRIATNPSESLERVSQAKAHLLTFVEGAPDAFVVTDASARILAANPAFIEMAQLTAEDQARGVLLERWVGRPGIDLDVFLTSLRQHRSSRLFATVLRGELGAVVEVEISAASIAEGDTGLYAFAIRNVERRLSAAARDSRQLPRSAEQVIELIGRVPLKDIVRETTDVIERLCIEAALELTGDNRASAAEMLGLSRQSLYVKLRRFGLADSTVTHGLDGH